MVTSAEYIARRSCGTSGAMAPQFPSDTPDAMVGWINPAFTMPRYIFGLVFRYKVAQMAYRSKQLREDSWDYRPESPIGENGNVLRFPRSDEENYGTAALDLVNQAADLFEDMEDHANQIESYAQSLCKSLADKLLLAERQREAADRARLETIHELNRRLQAATRALNQANSRIVSAEDYATAAEFRAQAAEHELSKANRGLAAVETAIRKRLL